MNNIINVFLIDDEFPPNVEFVNKGIYNDAISSDNLHYLSISEDWKSLHFLQELIKDIIISKESKSGLINLMGFKSPSIALANIDKGVIPSVVIYDWEYGMPNPVESQNLLLEILQLTKAVIFVYSKVRDSIPAFLNKATFDEYADRFQLFLKGDQNNSIFSTEEFILQYILSRVSKNIQLKIRGLNINFLENGYLEKPSDILYLEKILGRKLLSSKLGDNFSSITNESIESLLAGIKVKFLLDEKNQLLVTSDSINLVSKLQTPKELTGIEVLKKFGISALKEVLEIGIIKT